MTKTQNIVNSILLIIGSKICFLLFQIKLRRDPRVCYEASKALILLGKLFLLVQLFVHLSVFFDL